MFCLSCWDRSNQVPPVAQLVLLENPLWIGGAWRWFHVVWTYGVGIIEYSIILSKTIQENRNKIFEANSSELFVILEGLWWLGFLRVDFIIFRLMEIEFSVIFIIESWIKLKKTKNINWVPSSNLGQQKRSHD